MIPMAPPTRPSEADPPPQPTPERQLSDALACFQAEVSPIATADLAAVVAAARPAFCRGISWSAQLDQQQGRSRLQVRLMHGCGAVLCSETWADELSDLAASTGMLLALLLGIPVSSQARAVQPCSDEQPEVVVKPAVDDPALLALSEAEISGAHQRILALPQASRQELTKAFREHFAVPRSARSIGDRISQRQHLAFIEQFLLEAEQR